jgi:hypothetical protein
MSIRSNQARADRLAADAGSERRARRAHIARARHIFGRRLGSPVGLAACFGAGAVAGARLGRDPERPPADNGGSEDEQAGFIERMSDSPLGSIAIRLAAATLVRYLLTPSAPGDDAAAGEEIPGEA